MIRMFSFAFWVIQLLPTIAVCIFAFRWWRFWSIRFIVAAALLNVSVLYATYVIFQRGNGINAPGTPDWIIASIYTLAPFLSTLVLVLATLGLLSFLPGGERRGSRRDKLIVAAGIVSILALVGFVGFRAQVPPRPHKPLDPQKNFQSDYPLNSILRVNLEPKQAVFPYGSGTQFEITFTNASERDISLSGVLIDGLKFHPYIWIEQRRNDGRDLSYGTDLQVPRDHNVLRGGQTWHFDFPERTRTGPNDRGHNEDRQVLHRGDYSAFVAFWIEKDREYQRVVSSVVTFSVK